MSLRPAVTYVEITKAVEALVSRYAENSRASVASLIGRAALLQISAEQGNEAAAEKAYSWADEFATTGGEHGV